MSGTLTRHTGHEITRLHFISNRDTTTLRRLDCACGWAMTWLPELKGGDPDQPVLDGYAAHRKQVGAGVPHPIAYERNGWDFGQAIPGTSGQYRPKAAS